MKENRKISKNFIWTFVSVLLAILTIRVILKQNQDISIIRLLDILRLSNKPYFVTAVVSAALFVWFEGVAICSILKYAGHPRSLKKGFLYSTSDIYFSAITPSATGGQPASAFFMTRDGIPMGIVTATLILNLMMYTLSIIVLGILSILISPRAFWDFGSISKVFIGIGFVGLSVLVLIFFILLKKEELIFKPLSNFITFLYNKRLIKEKDKKLSKVTRIGNDYKACSAMISGKKRVLLTAFLWNLIQRSCQLVVPMLIYASLGGEKLKMALVFSKQCLVTIGYNFVPIPGGMGISDYLMIDGFCRMMNRQMAYNVELISRGITFYVCVSVSGIITLIGFLYGRTSHDRRL